MIHYCYKIYIQILTFLMFGLVNRMRCLSSVDSLGDLEYFYLFIFLYFYRESIIGRYRYSQLSLPIPSYYPRFYIARIGKSFSTPPSFSSSRTSQTTICHLPSAIYLPSADPSLSFEEICFIRSRWKWRSYVVLGSWFMGGEILEQGNTR